MKKIAVLTFIFAALASPARAGERTGGGRDLDCQIILRGYFYIRTLGPDGLREVSEVAVLNANYLLSKITRQTSLSPTMHFNDSKSYSERGSDSGSGRESNSGSDIGSGNESGGESVSSNSGGSGSGREIYRETTRVKKGCVDKNQSV